MIAGHTPGPWRLCGAFGMQGLVEPSAGGNPVASVTGYYHHAGQTEANARLIAAAPDLLEALQRLIPHAVHMESCSHDDDGVRRDIERARAAIAKAEGAP